MNARDDMNALRQAAEASSATLEKLKKQREEVNRQLAEIQETITMLENVIAAWNRLDPNRTKQEALSLTPAAPAEQPNAKVPYGQIPKHIKMVLVNGNEYSSPKDVQKEIIKRFNIAYREAQVGITLRRGIKQGWIGRSHGKYRLKEASQ